MEARRSGTRLEQLPESCRPSTLEQAYAVQAAVAEVLASPVLGWKVAITPHAGPVAAPLLWIVASGHCFPHYAGLGLETELGFLLVSDLPPRSEPYSREEVIDAVGAVVACFEIVGSRFAEAPAPSFPEFLADSLANAALVRGTADTPVRRLVLDRLPVLLARDGEVVWNEAGRHANADPLAPLVAYANTNGDHLGGLRAGQIIATGTLTGLATVPPASCFSADITPIGAVEISFNV